MVAAIGAIEKSKDHAEDADAKHGPGHVPEYFKKAKTAYRPMNIANVRETPMPIRMACGEIHPMAQARSGPMRVSSSVPLMKST